MLLVASLDNFEDRLGKKDLILSLPLARLGGIWRFFDF